MKKHNFSCFVHSAFISALILGVYFLWFIFLDRRYIFLYGHRHSTPFDFGTASRYWMTALVTGGIVLIAYTIVNLIIKKFRHNYQLPDWKAVWKYSCLILTLPILIFLLFIGKPIIPILLSLWILSALLSALALALYASNFIVNNFRKSIWAFFDGLALMPILQLLPLSIEYGLRKSNPSILVIAPVVLILVGLFWFWIMTFFYKRFKQSYTSSINIYLSGLTFSYLLLPLLHYLGSRPGYIRYVSDSANFFAKGVWLQAATFLVAAAVVWLVGKWRKNNADFNPVKKLLLFLTLLAVIGYSIMGVTTGRETDIWVCEDDQWVKQGNPPYEKPFDEECGIIDKAMGL